MKPSKFEHAVFEWIASHYDDPELESQMQDVEIVEREHTGVGCYSKITAPQIAQASERPNAARGPLSGPNFESPAVEYGGGTLLWFTDGVADLLEIFSYGVDFPENHSELADFTLENNSA